MSSWTHFRRVWLKPEVYPLIGSMAAALGFCGAALTNKILDPTVGWNKAKRKGDQNIMDGVDEVVPLWSGSKSSSIRIFGRENPVLDNKNTFIAPPTSVTIPGVAANDEPVELIETAVEVTLVKEDEKTPSAEMQEEEVLDEKPLHPKEAVLGVVDEAADTIHSAVDRAMHTAAAGVDAVESAASSVVDKVATTVVDSETLAEAHLREEAEEVAQTIENQKSE